MERILVLNPKGGSGKTTVATNLAAYFATKGANPVLVDLDPQGSSVRWISHRPPEQASIECIDGVKDTAMVTRSWLMRPRPGCDAIVIDTPAAVDARRFPEITRGADTILVPVMPSEIDIHATAKCIADLLLVAKIRRADNRIGIIANRVKANTRVSKALTKFLQSLDIPLVATLRDTQHYVRAAQMGIGIFEMPAWQTGQDVETWGELFHWLEQKRASGGSPRSIDSSLNLAPQVSA